MTRAAPHDLNAEVTLIGAAFRSKSALEVLCTETTPEDFYVKNHQDIAAMFKRLSDAGDVNLDWVIVSAEMRRCGLMARFPSEADALAAVSGGATTRQASKHARLIVEAAVLRRLIEAASDITEMAYGHPGDVIAAVDKARTLVDDVGLPAGGSAPSETIDEFLAGSETYDWLIPGLLERRDRLILTAGEGGGKSTLLRQLATCIAAGIHPFSYQPVDPAKVLVVDVENSPQQTRRKYRDLRDIAAARLDPANLRIEVRTEGIDLLARHDRQWLIDRVASNRPDVLVIGPVYKLFSEDPSSEPACREVVNTLDLIRGKWNVTILLEAHSPHQAPGSTKRNLRPIGSSIWQRWAEFGFGLSPSMDPTTVFFEAWRGPRDLRAWPKSLTHGGAGSWPWVDPHANTTATVRSAS